MAIRSLKLSFNGEIRRFSLDSLNIVEGNVSLEDLKKVVRSTFVELKEKDFVLCYKDEDEDVITVSTDAEIEEAFSVAQALDSKVLRLEITAIIDKPQSKAVHFRVICDGCGQNPIMGDRFKCSVRDDFDLCAECERTDQSPHPYLKIKTPAQAPAAIMTILKSHQDHSEVTPDFSFETVPPVFAAKISETQEQFQDEVIGSKEQPKPKSVEPKETKPKDPKQQKPKEVKEKEQKPKVIAGITMPSLVRLECLSALREFGPFYALTRPNGTLVFRSPTDATNTNDKAWKQGGCLRVVRSGPVVMDGNGGPWASFHVEPVASASSDKVVRLVCANRRLCLAVANGQLVSAQASHTDVNTQFILHEAGNADEVDPIWDAMTAMSSPAAAAESENTNTSPWDEPTKNPLEDNFVGWEGMSASLMADVQAAMGDNALPPSPPVPQPTPQASFLNDVTIPDGQVMQGGESFIKAWRMRNDSDFNFPANVRLVHVSGAIMSDVTEVSVSNNGKPILPLEEFDVAVPMVAPRNPGKYGSYWRLEVDGERFGHQVWVEVCVKESPEDLMKAAQEEAAKIQLDIANAKAAREQKQQEEKEKKAKAEAEAARLEAERAAAAQALVEAQVLETQRAQEEKLAAEAAQQAEEERVKAEQAKAEQAELEEFERAAAARLEDEKKQQAELEALMMSEQARIDSEQQVADLEAASDNGNSIDWEHIEVNKEEGSTESVENDDVSDLGSEQLYSSDLSASVEGAAMAGAALANESLSESLVAQVARIEAQSDDSMGPWGAAVSRILDMGFTDIPAIIAACEKVATPENYESRLEVIVNELFSA